MSIETIIKELNSEKLRLSTINKSVCEHLWRNTGLCLQGKKMMQCIVKVYIF